MLSDVKVFARSKPHQKARIVKLYQRMGKVVGMCGDGANDCEALTQAHIGLSLSDTEASVAAPFTAQNRNISSMVELIKHARGGLVTNTSLFNIVCLYAFTQYTTGMLSYFMFSYTGVAPFTYWDLFINFPSILLLPLVPVANELSLERPPSRLLSFRNLSQVGTAVFLQMVAQIIALIAVSGIFSEDLDYGTVYGPQVNLELYREHGRFV